MRGRSGRSSRGSPEPRESPPRACRFHPRFPVAFELCGWETGEVSEDLGFLLRGKYLETLGRELRPRPGGPDRILIEDTHDAEAIQRIVDSEKGDVRSLTGVKEIEIEDGGLLRLHPSLDPDLYRTERGSGAKCLLYRPGTAAA